MKSVVSLALVVVVVVSAVPIAAQEWVDPAAGPIHRAMAREAFRISTEDVTPFRSASSAAYAQGEATIRQGISNQEMPTLSNDRLADVERRIQTFQRGLMQGPLQRWNSLAVNARSLKATSTAWRR